MAATSKTAFKILSADQWAEWQKTGTFAGASIDLTDGYIHLSTAQTAGETFEKYFAGQQNLVVVEVDLAQLGDAIKWEPSRGGALFPHVYGSIPSNAVLRSWDKVDSQLFETLLKDSA
ncbi:hypothetical protein GTA08_BOTSDO04801 [Neofusicoccum parvum]|uniref:DUF952 domain-containing protein n=1 Tax=Botryosphaeria parva (strain UCR-NP2) TaxID=1287680 RepID=R1G8P4_BOTPV|nr:hypothetical protein UCRNP2_5365 [Neofusicoccum parvum UCRNP2]GME65617.1 hypothetical protein GTA08_BOTSDO04801 [Neofusicoccum parvum]